jgi:sortase A
MDDTSQKLRESIQAFGYFLSLVFITFMAFFLISFSVSATKIDPAKIDTPKPAVLIIPKIKLMTNIEEVGNENSRMATPINPNNVGWWKFGIKPGEIGSAVIDGHVDTPNSPVGVFYNLTKLNNKDLVLIKTQDGTTYTFEVINESYFSDDSFPISLIFSKNDNKYLNLITCSGDFNKETKSFNERFVVFTKEIN